MWSLSARRAWIEIFAVISLIYQQAKSLSARRAWIEICFIIVYVKERGVALRKESVDRNLSILLPNAVLTSSLSARRAWIEISTQCKL